MKVDQPDIVDFAVHASDLGITALELDGNTSPSQMRSHGEVSNRCDHGDGGGDVVENALLARLCGGKTTEGDCACNHQSRDGPVPIRTVIRNGDIGRGIADGVICKVLLAMFAVEF